MRQDLFHAHLHLSRRDALRMAGSVGAAGAAGAILGARPARAEVPGQRARAASPRVEGTEEPSDEMFDVEAVRNGAWVPGPYGPQDQKGSFNEVTAAKTAEALQLLDRGRDVVTYNLGERLFNGFPAYVTAPPRQYEQRLVVLGYQPEPGFAGILQSPVPLGPNQISAHEERLVAQTTYQIATQLDNLNHIGVGEMFYNGFRGPDIAEDWGTNKLGNEWMQPVVTRGILLDILDLKVSQGETGNYFTASNGEKVLKDDYRITVEDIEAAMDREGIDGVRSGDAVLLRTGWTHLVRSEPERYVAAEPGIYLREARHLGPMRPALIGSDTWALEVLDEDVTEGNLFPVHQILLMKYGIRIGEAVRTEELAGDGVFEFVYVVTPQVAEGATAGNTPPAALAQPPRRT